MEQVPQPQVSQENQAGATPDTVQNSVPSQLESSVSKPSSLETEEDAPKWNYIGLACLGVVLLMLFFPWVSLDYNPEVYKDKKIGDGQVEILKKLYKDKNFTERVSLYQQSAIQAMSRERQANEDEMEQTPRNILDTLVELDLDDAKTENSPWFLIAGVVSLGIALGLYLLRHSDASALMGLAGVLFAIQLFLVGLPMKMEHVYAYEKVEELMRMFRVRMPSSNMELVQSITPIRYSIFPFATVFLCFVPIFHWMGSTTVRKYR